MVALLNGQASLRNRASPVAGKTNESGPELSQTEL
jgi:hypothetical protein